MSWASANLTESASDTPIVDFGCATEPTIETAAPAGAGSRIGVRGAYEGWLPSREFIRSPKTLLIQLMISGVLRKFVESCSWPVSYFFWVSKYRLISARRNRYIDCLGSPTKKS